MYEHIYVRHNIFPNNKVCIETVFKFSDRQWSTLYIVISIASCVINCIAFFIDNLGKVEKKILC